MAEELSIKDFEAAIAELETIVKKLEDGDLTLESSLALYERGVQLSRFCHTRLEDVERRIEILNERGELKPAPAGLGSDDPMPDGGEAGGDRHRRPAAALRLGRRAAHGDRGVARRIAAAPSGGSRPHRRRDAV